MNPMAAAIRIPNARQTIYLHEFKHPSPVIGFAPGDGYVSKENRTGDMAVLFNALEKY